MPERPLLILPTPGAPVERRKKRGGAGTFHRPDRRRQSERLEPRFRNLQRALEARRVRLLGEAGGLAPEEVVVLETVGQVSGFLRAVQSIEGLEWLGEIEEEDIPPDDDFFALNSSGEPRPDRMLRGRLFMVFTNQVALRQILSLWALWQRGETLPHGFRRWRTLFEQLRDVRPWGVRDRLLETGIIDDWRERIGHGREEVPCELELWFRASPQRRESSRNRVARLVAAINGRVVTEAVIEEIGYHALLTRLPVESVMDVVERGQPDTELVQCEQVQFFRAAGQMVGVMPRGEPEEEPEAAEEEPNLPRAEPVVALLDGLPLQAHQRLSGRIVVDDPDDFEGEYAAADRRHGTAMASLIVHGDLAAREAPLSRPLYVRPILRADARYWAEPRPETVPEDVLVVDLVHRAVRRLFEGEGNEVPVAPTVAVINLSIGIKDRPFDGALSPLARLLDWLAWRYKTLFVVSAGNHGHSLELPTEPGSLATLPADELQALVIRAVASDSRHRRLLSPAESLNGLTVGAVHHDASLGDPTPPWVSPYQDVGLPSPINAQGMGYRRAIKPDLLASGGRVAIHESGVAAARPIRVDIYAGIRPPGQTVAAPGGAPGDRRAVSHSCGTSNAAALVSRGGAILYDVLEELRAEPGGDLIDAIPRAVWLKALLAHAADWGESGHVLDTILRTRDNSRQFREYVTRLLGYGALQLDRICECTQYRATAISGGVLLEDQSHLHQYPLPPSLSGRRGHRRLTVTLAWFTPVNPRHQDWRRADLWFQAPRETLRLDRQQADAKAVQRGTVQHEILEGQRAAAFVDGDNCEIQVSCRADAGTLEEAVPYALITTLEVAEDIGVPIYEEIRVRVQQRVRIAAAG